MVKEKAPTYKNQYDQAYGTMSDIPQKGRLTAENR